MHLPKSCTWAVPPAYCEAAHLNCTQLGLLAHALRHRSHVLVSLKPAVTFRGAEALPRHSHGPAGMHCRHHRTRHACFRNDTIVSISMHAQRCVQLLSSGRGHMCHEHSNPLTRVTRCRGACTTSKGHVQQPMRPVSERNESAGGIALGALDGFKLTPPGLNGIPHIP